MNYLINENIFTLNSGTEHAQARRIKMLNQSGQSSKFVTRQYNRYLDRDRQNLDLKTDQIINMYDFFQGTLERTSQPQNLRDLPSLPLQKYHLENSSPDYAIVKHHGRQIARVNILPATIGLVGEVLYNDRADNVTLRENWDWRGFCSSIDRFMPDGKLSSRQFLNLAGEVVIEVVYMVGAGELQPTQWHLIQYHGRDYRFKTENELFRFFLNELGRLDPTALFISERRSMDLIVAQIETVKHKIAILHEAHTPDSDHPRQGALYPSYQPLLESVGSQFDLILTATNEQCSDLAQRYPSLRFARVQDTTLFAPELSIQPNDKRIARHLLWLGRLSPERNPEGALKLLKQIQSQVSDVTLEFMGYAQSPEYLEQFKKKIIQMGLGQVVFISPYGGPKQVQVALQRASILISTAPGEGQGMHLVEGLANGLPLVVVENRYTTQNNHIIEDGQNGLIINLKQPKKWLPALEIILEDETAWVALQQQSYHKAQAFTVAAGIKNWQAILAQLG